MELEAVYSEYRIMKAGAEAKGLKLDLNINIDYMGNQVSFSAFARDPNLKEPASYSESYYHWARNAGKGGKVQDARDHLLILRNWVDKLPDPEDRQVEVAIKILNKTRQHLDADNRIFDMLRQSLDEKIDRLSKHVLTASSTCHIEEPDTPSE